MIDIEANPDTVSQTRALWPKAGHLERLIVAYPPVEITPVCVSDEIDGRHPPRDLLQMRHAESCTRTL
jgi:hypothetical protein